MSPVHVFEESRLPGLHIDAEFRRLIPALLPDEFKHLEANILQDGEIKDPLAVWNTGDQCILLDGHNRHTIAEKHDLTFTTTGIVLPDREHAKLWIATHQLGRRNLTDDQRADIANEVREICAAISKIELAREAGKEGGRGNTKALADSTKPFKSPINTRKTVAIEAKLPERKIRLAQEIKKVDPVVSAMVRAGGISLAEGRKIVSLPVLARKNAIKAIAEGDDVRAAIRTAKKADYNANIAAMNPRKLEGTYRVIYADPPWKYIGLNQVDEYGHAERHYDCLDDQQLKQYKVGGTQLVKDLTDKDAVLFLWVTSPLLARCFSIIEAWGFEYKACFVWDKIRHNMGHYNSVRHEFLLICTRGSCKPDVSKLIDSVQSIERSNIHSAKPEEFRQIIESLYDHGRKLELFRRGSVPEGWDTDGNEAQ